MLAMLFRSPTWQACRTKLRQVWQKTPQDGKDALKRLPLSRPNRRLLLQSSRWVVDVCSGPSSPENPLKDVRPIGLAFLEVDLEP